MFCRESDSAIGMSRAVSANRATMDAWNRRRGFLRGSMSGSVPPSRGWSGWIVSFLAGKYDRDRFYEMAKGLEEVKEGGSRCMGCYELRLKEAAEIAVAGEFDYFTTTLSISPMKNAQKLNEIGQRVGEEYGVQYLLSDFKKKNGYKRSIELSGIHGLYRQDYCGCEFSYKARQAEKCV